MSGSKSVWLVLLISFVGGCLDPYTTPHVGTQSDYLVVDGFLNASDGSCTIYLSRSLPLASSESPSPIFNAVVLLEDDQGGAVALPIQANSSSGMYSNTNLSLDLLRNYRLHIITNGKSYASEFVPINQSQVVDSLGWFLDRRSIGDPIVTVYLNSHGTNEQSRYYLWKYQETWMYTSGFSSTLKYVNGQVLSNFDTTYICWQTLNSTTISIASTTTLSENVVSGFKITSFPISSSKLMNKYSIAVQQLSITKDAFEYWQQMKANSENTGTIFGVQPSRFAGNIHSESDPSEPVFGFFSASTVAERRIFIRPAEVPYPPEGFITGYENCKLDTLRPDQLNELGAQVLVSSYGIGPVGYIASSSDCTDCRLKGGTNVKPKFWN